MSNFSVALQQNWMLRVTSGPMAGKEFALPPGHYVLGSQSPATLLVNVPGVAPQHLALDITPTSVTIQDQSGQGFQINGRTVTGSPAKPGDRLRAGSFEFQLVNAALAASMQQPPPSALASLHRLPPGLPIGLATLAIALVLFGLLVATRNPNLVPITLFAMSAVVPAGVMTFVVTKFDETGISFRTLAVTFLLGGSVGVICTVLLNGVASALTMGAFALPIFAGLYEEPAKLVATSWRWKHPAYDRPMDGLIIGLVSGFGFAVFETAGYGLTQLMQAGPDALLSTMILRGVLSPFGHGLWCGITAAAFWQAGRDVRMASRDRTFLRSLLEVIGLHALWNAPFIGFLGPTASASLTLMVFRNRLAHKGFRQ